MQQNNSKIWGTAVVVTGSASHRLRSHSRPHQYALILSLSALAAGCGGAGSSAGRDTAQVTPTQPTSSTPTLDYPGPALFTLGTRGVFLPSEGSGGSAISIDPSLPPGLTIDSSTGAITGTATEPSPARDYQVSVIASRAISVNLTLEVTSGPLFYPSPALLQVGYPMMPLTPTGTDFLTGFYVSPALPEGISIDPVTGIISGTPTKPSPPTYYVISGADSEFYREYGLTLRVGDSAPSTTSTAGFECVHSGGFVGTFKADSTSANYGLIAIAFTPDGRAHARVQDLSTNETIDSDGQDGLSGAADGSFTVTFAAPSDVSINGNFTGPDVISGTVMEGTVAKPFVAMRLGGSSTADYRYTGGFGNDNGYRVDFGTVDVTGSNLSGTGYQMNYVDAQSVLTNRELSFGTTLSDGMFVVTVDGSTSTSKYTAGQPTLNLGDPYDALLFLESTGCVLN
jgi:hypothetical protein